MRSLIHLAKPMDLSDGFTDFFKTIGLTGSGLVIKGTVAVLAVIAVNMLLHLNSNPRTALRKGGMAVGTLLVAVVLALYGDSLFSTVTGGGEAS